MERRDERLILRNVIRRLANVLGYLLEPLSSLVENDCAYPCRSWISSRSPIRVYRDPIHRLTVYQPRVCADDYESLFQYVQRCRYACRPRSAYQMKPASRRTRCLGSNP